MRNKLKKEIYLVSDFVARCNTIPNCLNHERTKPLFDSGGYIDDTVMNYYFENFIQIPNIVGTLNVDSRLLTPITTFEYFSKYKNNNEIFLYSVEPYANIVHATGAEASVDGVFCLEFASKIALEELQKTDNNFYFMFSFPNEGTIQESTFSNIYAALEKYNIPPYKFIFIIASADIKYHHQEFCTENNIPTSKQIMVEYWTWSLREKAREAIEIEENPSLTNIDGTHSTIVTPSDIDLDRKRPHRFMIFNRRMRVHRILLLSLVGLDFINDNLVSYDFGQTVDRAQPQFFHDRIINKYKDHCLENLDEIITKKPLSYIDFKDVDSTMGFGCENKTPYLDSYIHVTTETNFDEPGAYFSEKTWKPIINLQPFIMVNYYQGLKYLKEIGFKTFHPFIDESYDEIKQPKRRIAKIYEEIDRLSKLSIDEIHEWYMSIYDILIYNRELLYKHQGDYMYNKEAEYLTKIIDYVESN